ncbi:uncharacterized protein LOC129592964 [Paramacrobiotus metropolitanus]|uniref:uncharacterized protein LOC129592964 n=1 Tax=Paramacrobiotus metropolitanus TaxID=2943436 RepID=UPI0024462AE8|nr:uncharacterized protein LOC129592964 [Paramacrobiotus metropolitanus]
MLSHWQSASLILGNISTLPTPYLPPDGATVVTGLMLRGRALGMIHLTNFTQWLPPSTLSTLILAGFLLFLIACISAVRGKICAVKDILHNLMYGDLETKNGDGCSLNATGSPTKIPHCACTLWAAIDGIIPHSFVVFTFWMLLPRPALEYLLPEKAQWPSLLFILTGFALRTYWGFLNSARRCWQSCN